MKELPINADRLSGHLAAFTTVSVWSVTYISTKVLLTDFTPLEVLFIRFFIAIFVLKLISFRSVGFRKSEQLYFALAGFTGPFLYFLVENIALLYTTAVNVGIILTITPMFTAIVTNMFYKDERKLDFWFYLGFFAAVGGIVLLSVKGSANLSFNPLGDFLSVSAGIVWAVYSVFTRKINSFGYSTPAVTRRSFEYGIIYMIPLMFLTDFCIEPENLIKPLNLGNLVFLGFIASAASFTFWNYSVKKIGAVTSIIYIYITPVMSALAADFFLGEKLSLLGWIACLITTLGLFISQGGPKFILKKLTRNSGNGSSGRQNA